MICGIAGNRKCPASRSYEFCREDCILNARARMQAAFAGENK
jgi:hypothetical protein